MKRKQAIYFNGVNVRKGEIYEKKGTIWFKGSNFKCIAEAGDYLVIPDNYHNYNNDGACLLSYGFDL